MLGNNVSSVSQKFGEEHRVREEKAQVRYLLTSVNQIKQQSSLNKILVV